ncbi:hypothetical protein ABKV19_026412 [Rosa sericea]
MWNLYKGFKPVQWPAVSNYGWLLLMNYILAKSISASQVDIWRLSQLKRHSTPQDVCQDFAPVAKNDGSSNFQIKTFVNAIAGHRCT